MRHYHTNHLNLSKRLFQYECTQCEAFFSIPHISKYKSAEATEQEMISVWNEKTEYAKKGESNGTTHT